MYKRYGCIFLAAISLGVLTGCSGIRSSNGTFTTHAESIRVLGYAIPADDQARANELVPPGGQIVSVDATPADWTSFVGVIGNILWPHQTRITGVVQPSIKR